MQCAVRCSAVRCDAVRSGAVRCGADLRRFTCDLHNQGKKLQKRQFLLKTLKTLKKRRGEALNFLKSKADGGGAPDFLKRLKRARPRLS